MNEISFVDTTLRDGQQSLWALNMKTDAMLGAAEQMDQAGFESLEFFSSNMIKKYVREHKEIPGTGFAAVPKSFAIPSCACTAVSTAPAHSKNFPARS